MTQTLEAVYENGVFRPLSEPAGVAEHARVTISVIAESAGPPLDLVGSLPHEDAEEMRAIIQREFSRVDPE
jgi:predicted DNA-binding antitoxin AbrB/MazE fold protein